MGVRSAQEGSVHAEQQLPPWQQGQQKGEKDWFRELGIPAAPFHPAFLRLNGAGPGEIAEVTLVHAPGRHQSEDDVHDTLQRVMAEERNAGFEVAGEFGTLEIGGF